MILLAVAALVAGVILGWRALALVDAQVTRALALREHAQHVATTQQQRATERAQAIAEGQLALDARRVALAEAQVHAEVAVQTATQAVEARKVEPLPDEAMALVTRESELWAQDQVAGFLRERYKVHGDWSMAIRDARRLVVSDREAAA